MSEVKLEIEKGLSLFVEEGKEVNVDDRNKIDETV